MENTNMFNIAYDRMDWKYITNSIITFPLLEDYKEYLIINLHTNSLEYERDLEMIILTIKHNNELVPSYKNHLIELVKEMNGELDE